MGPSLPSVLLCFLESLVTPHKSPACYNLNGGDQEGTQENKNSPSWHPRLLDQTVPTGRLPASSQPSFQRESSDTGGEVLWGPKEA